MQVGGGTSDFTPTPEESRQIIRAGYDLVATPTLMVRFSDDGIDQTPEMLGILGGCALGGCSGVVCDAPSQASQATHLALWHRPCLHSPVLRGWFDVPAKGRARRASRCLAATSRPAAQTMPPLTSPCVAGLTCPRRVTRAGPHAAWQPHHALRHKPCLHSPVLCGWFDVPAQGRARRASRCLAATSRPAART